VQSLLQRLWADRVAQSPSGHAVGLGEAVHHHGAIAQPINLQAWDVAVVRG
jgi:hypothetical protein